jgi:antitoxin component HigA of HigAB toxin-antitoxin module
MLVVNLAASRQTTTRKNKHGPLVRTQDKGGAVKTMQKRVNWCKGDARVKLEAAVLKWKEVGGTMSLRAFADTEGLPFSTLQGYVSGRQEMGAGVGKRRKFTVSKTKADEANMKVPAKVANVKGALHGKQQVGAGAVKTMQKRVNWCKGDARVKLEAAALKWKEVGGTMSLRAFADTEGLPFSTLHGYVSGKQEMGAGVGKRRKFTVSKTKADEDNMKVPAKVANVNGALHGKQQVGARVGRRSKLTISKMKADEANMKVPAKVANVKAAVHDERIKRLESKLVGVTEHTVGPSGLRVGCRVDFASERFAVKHAERSPLSEGKAEWKTMREELSVEEIKKKMSAQRESSGDEATQQTTVQSHGEGNCG